MAVVEEVPEEAIQEVETGTSAGRTSTGHGHEGVTGENGTLRAHLEEVHQLEVPSEMSPSTQTGLHDRLHDDTAAADD